VLKPFVILQPNLRLIDPHTCTDAKAVRNLRFALYEALVEQRGETFSPLLAEKWQCSEDARTWVFSLQAAVRFHDGKSLTAGDVAYSFQRVVSPLATGELFTVTFRDYLKEMKLEAPDRHTLRIITPEPMADLLELLCDIVIIPEGTLPDRISDSLGANKGTQPPPGTGPYRLESIGSQTALLRPWEQYWKGERQQRLVEFRSVAEEAARIEALKADGADLITHLSPAAVADLDQYEDCRVWPLDSSLCVVYLMNLSTDYLRDIRVRQALNYGLDKQRIVEEILNGRGRILNGPLSSLHFGYDPNVPAFPFDPRRARKLLAEAGLQGQEVRLHSPLALPDEAPGLTRMLAAQFQAIGIEARIEEHPDRFEYARAIAEKQLEGLFCFDSSPSSTFRVLREKLDSRFRGPWWQGYHSDAANELLSQAAASVDVARRQALYRQAYRIFREEAPWLYLYQPHSLWGVRSSVPSVVRAGRDTVLRFA
jgi:peptide/nickel transport system substrate-binding protein